MKRVSQHSSQHDSLNESQHSSQHFFNFNKKLTTLFVCFLISACTASTKNETLNAQENTADVALPVPEKKTIIYPNNIARDSSNIPPPEVSFSMPYEAANSPAYAPQMVNAAPPGEPPSAPPSAPYPNTANQYRLSQVMPAERNEEANLATQANTAKYREYKENAWKRVAKEPVATFSADVDTGSYANVRRFIKSGQFPFHDAIRAEEMINYFPYDYTAPGKDTAQAFNVHTQMTTSPWNETRSLLRIAIKGKDVAKENLPAANLVFLVDVSGSMEPEERLPLIKASLKLLTKQLRSQDRVSLVTYADGTKLALAPTSGDKKEIILQAIERLQASGSTNGEAGIRLAYAQAHAAQIKGGINRVLLATDGDLNVGITDDRELTALVERERKAGIGLSTLGVGDDNYNEALMKKLADNGDGSYHYLDSLAEAHKVLVNEFTSTLSVIAKDLKLQLEFNPALVKEYRLIGYELRALTREQFNDDKVDAGDIGSGHAVTALFEIVPHNAKGNVDAVRYQAEERQVEKVKNRAGDHHKNELAWLKLRYKTPESTKSTLLEVPIIQPEHLSDVSTADADFRFAAAVAGWAQWLRGSPLIGNLTTKQITALALGARGEDRYGHRAEFIRLVASSAQLKRSEHQQGAMH